jgi:peptidoglycan/LPS O-acetylase OafA/YrhL
MKYRPDIDGLRSIAVLSVVFFHGFPTTFPGGFIGVDVFFVLSGFLISNILFNQIENGAINWSLFYLNRIKRIFPALLLVLLSAIIIGYFLLLPIEYENLGKHIAGGSLFINNFILWHEAGYFDKTSVLKPLIHLWSLGIEEQFYLIWPMLIFFVWRLRLNPIISLIIFSVISFSINLAWINHANIRAFYFPISRFWELGLGGLLAYITFNTMKHNNLRVFRISKNLIAVNLLSIFALSSLVMCIFFFSERLSYPGWAALMPTGCTTILLFTDNSWINRNILSFRLMTFIGLISYPLYLWHWELFSFARIVYSGTISSELTTFLIVLSFLLAWLTYQTIEKPIRFSKWAKQHSRYIALLLFGGLFIIGLVGVLINQNHGFINRTMVKKNNLLLNDITAFNDFRKQTIPCGLVTQHKDLKQITWCLQNKKGRPQKVVWGDSHAEHLFPGIIKSDKVTNWLLLEQSSCPPLMGVESYWRGASDQCKKSNDSILKAIIATPSIDTVVLSSMGPFYISDDNYAAGFQGSNTPDRHFLKTKNLDKPKRGVFYDGLSKTIYELKKAGKKVILFQDTPELPFMPERCINRRLSPKKTCFITKESVMARQRQYVAILQKISRGQKIPIFNPINLICNEHNCPLIKNHHLIYRDSHHLSVAGSELIGEHFISWIKKLTY